MKTSRELRQRYFAFMARGAYTSLPFLAFHPEGYKKLTTAHWNRSYEGGSYRRAAVTRHLLGIGPVILGRLQEKGRRLTTFKNCQADREQQLKMIRENIEKSRSGQTIPLPRDLISVLRQAREGSEKQQREAQSARDRESRSKLTVTNASGQQPPTAAGEKRKRKRKPKIKNKP